MNLRDRDSFALCATMVAVITLAAMVPAGSQPPARQTSADLRTGAQTGPDPSNQRARSANTPAPVPLEEGNPLWAVPLSSLTPTRERPLFSPTRRPPPLPIGTSLQPQQSPAAIRPPLSLVGAIAGDTDGIAIFVDEATKSMIRVRTGESYQGWTLRSVQKREATLQSDRQTAVLELSGGSPR
jgi:hypothetical protein